MKLPKARLDKLKLGGIWLSIASTTFALGWSVAWSADAVTSCLVIALLGQSVALASQYLR